MEIRNIRSKFAFDKVVCKKLTKNKLPMCENGVIQRTRQGDYYFWGKNNNVRFQLQDNDYQRDIEDLFARNYQNVACIHQGEDSLFTMEIRFFPTVSKDLSYLGNVTILIPNKIRQSLIEYGIVSSKESNLNLLLNEFTFSDGRHNNFIYSKGWKTDNIEAEVSDDENVNGNEKVEKKDVVEAVESNKTMQLSKFVETEDTLNGNKSVNTEVSQPEIEGSLRLFGDNCDLLIHLERIGNEERIQAYRVIFHPKNYKGMQIKATGNLAFSDTESFITTRIRKRLQETPNYLKTWEEYERKEGQFLLAKAQKIGVIDCLTKYNIKDDNKLQFTVQNISPDDLKRFSMLQAGDILEYIETPPLYLSDDITWDEYKKKIEEEKQILLQEGALSNKNKILFQVVSYPKSIHNPFLVLQSYIGKLPLIKKQVIQFAFSIIGDEMQIKRREEARKRIVEGRSAMPNLGLILGAESDAADFILQDNHRKHIQAISPLIRKKVFDYPPTNKQEEAIDIALNTPDIAVIQGPPGTGKTTVIIAILERLNELMDKQKLEPGQVLITSLQHDAVNNIVERLSINSLPTIKFGQRASEQKQDLDISTRQWCEVTAATLEKKYDFLQKTAEQLDLIRSFNQYARNPDDRRAKDFLLLARNKATEGLVKRIDAILQNIQDKQQFSNDTNTLLMNIYRLPITKEAWQDNGSKMAQNLLFELMEQFGEDFGQKEDVAFAWQKEVRSVLNQAIRSSQSDFLIDLSKIRKQLLNRFIPRPVLQRNEPREDIINIYREIQQYMKTPDDEMKKAIYQFYVTLSEGDIRVRKALASYTFAFAATAQQSEGKEIKKAKGITHYKDLEAHASYDTVIVDEAARVPPGDLMIPLSQAKRRIIMVGDQNQLPHIYNADIFEALRKEGKMVSEADIQSSLFEHLWNSAKVLEKSDGIHRTVTLDKQYRTHPLMGDFVSKNFYDGKVQSGRPAEDFKQPISSHACVWVNISADKGKSSKLPSGSRIRDVEAEYIVKKLAEYLQREDCKKLTFGAISFYAGQRDLIKNKLRKYGIEPENNARLRIGSVDEFQGMEFDVIFLSVVRSGANFHAEDLYALQKATQETLPDIRSEISRKYYGFLNDNRLCVALSRQKKLLIVVGDAEMFAGRLGGIFANYCVKSMHNLYILCKEEGSVINGGD